MPHHFRVIITILVWAIAVHHSQSVKWIKRLLTEPRVSILSIFQSQILDPSNMEQDIAIEDMPKRFTQPVFNSSVIATRKGQKPFVLVTFVNGIYHSVDDWTRIANNLENIFHCEVRPFYNPTSGWWVKDISRAGFDLVLRPNDLILSRELAEHMRAALLELHPKGRLLHLAHSGGAILTYLAAKNHLTYQEISRIDVATFGAGKSITRKYFKGWVRNYYARNDPLTVVDTRANKLLKRSGTSPVIEIRDAKHNTSFVYIEPLENNPISDHSMECRTYAIALHLEAQALQQRLQHIMRHHAREMEWSRQVRKAAANITGLHHFWDRFLPSRTLLGTRGIRKAIAQRTGMRGYFSKKYLRHNATIIDENKIMSDATVCSFNRSPVSFLFDSQLYSNGSTVYEDQILFGDSH